MFRVGDGELAMALEPMALAGQVYGQHSALWCQSLALHRREYSNK
jgi:hypothetical protein